MIKVHVHHYHHYDFEVLDKLNHMKTALDNLQGKVSIIMATIDDILNDVAQETDLIQSVITLIDGLKQQLADALADTTLPTEVQTKIDAAFAAIEANKAALATAVPANTDAETGA